MHVVQLVVNGLLLGGVFALSALGFNIIFGVMRVVNLAHGDIVVLAALLCAYEFGTLGFNPLIVLPAAIAGGFVAGAAIYAFLLRRLPGEIASAEASSLTLTFGLSFFLVGSGLAIFGGTFRSVPFLTGALYVGAISVPEAKLLAFVTALILALLLGAFLRFTPVGCAIRATSQHVEGALACGVDIDRVKTLSFGLGTAVAAAAGTLLSMIYDLSPQMGVEFTVNAFAVVVIGGLGNYAGCFLGAMILGLADELTSYYIGANLAEAAPYVLFILVSLLRPSGLLGRRVT